MRKASQSPGAGSPRLKRRLLPVFCAAAGFMGVGADARAQQPVVVELFTSQGCSSCPPANTTLAALADRPDVLALSFGVTYWDSLGWKDTFASSQFTARQWDYARGLRHDEVWTPQMVVQGRTDTVGQDRSKIEPLIRAELAARRDAPSISLSQGIVTIGARAVRGPADVWLVRYDPRVVQVPVRRGENGGRTLPHRDVVRELVRLGAWNGRAVTFAFKPPTDPNLKSAVLVQAGPGGPILAAAKS